MACTTLSDEVNSLYSTAGGLISVPNFHYGYFEAYVKLNKGGGWHNAFWLMCGKYVFPSSCPTQCITY